MYAILQIIISVVVIYLIFSVIVYVIVEWISGILQMRGRMLQRAIRDLFRDERLGLLIYHHPHVESLKPANGRLPSYIPSASVASALIDAIGSRVDENPETRISEAYKNFIAGVNLLEKSPHKDLLISLAQQSKDVKELAASIEKWFNDAMDRVSGWYKKRLRLVIFIVASIVTVGFNVDTIHIILAAKADPILRQRLNDLGDKLLADPTINEVVSKPGADLDYYEDYVNDSSISVSDSIELEVENTDSTLTTAAGAKLDQFIYMNQLVRDSELPIGWGLKRDTELLYLILGWALTVVALTAGAPFWFDILKKLVNIRAAGIKPTMPNK